jgi:hypothetical protein
MAIGDALVGLLVLGLWLFCLFDVITTDESLMRNLGKVWWVVIVLFFPVVGSIMWLVAGRPQGAGTAGMPYKGNAGTAGTSHGSRYGSGGLAPVRRQVAPDDDPEFLEQVRRQNAEDKDLLRRWEDDLRRREDELRKGDDEPGSPGGPTPAG